MRFGAGREPRPLDPRAEAVLMRAWELPADDVDAFLRDACGDDEVLRGEVESMLRAAGDADRYFEGLAGRLGVAAALADEDPAIVGRRLGAYRLLELIGRGGMGAV